MPAEEVLKRFEKKFPSAKQDVLKLMEEITDLAEKLIDLLEELNGTIFRPPPRRLTRSRGR